MNRNFQQVCKYCSPVIIKIEEKKKIHTIFVPFVLFAKCIFNNEQEKDCCAEFENTGSVLKFQWKGQQGYVLKKLVTASLASRPISCKDGHLWWNRLTLMQQTGL